MDERAELKALREYAREATKVLTNLAGGGSEMFSGMIGDIYKADLHFCAKRVKERHDRLHDLWKSEIRRRKAAEDELQMMFPPQPAEQTDA